MAWIDLVSAGLFYSIVLLFVYKNRKKFERHMGIIFLYRTKKGLGLIKRIGERYSILIKGLATIGVLVSIYYIVTVVRLFVQGVLDILAPSDAQAQFALFIPGINIPGSPLFIPFWYGIISAVVLIVVHEMAHALVAAAEKIKLKNDGFGFLFFIPLFFVEPDEKQMMARKGIVRMRVAAAGAFANILLATVLGLFVVNALLPVAQGMMDFNGVEIISTKDGFPAATAGIENGVIISSINGTKIDSVDYFVSFLSNSSAGDTILMSSNEGVEYIINSIANPSNESQSYIGISFQPFVSVKPSVKERFFIIPDLFLMLIKLLNWIAFLNLGVGVMNFVPIWVLDGGHITFDLIKYFIPDEKKAMKIANYVFMFVLFIFLFNIFGPVIF